jgi:3-phosphoshikimate 1-carboxyvinyltransferase
MILTGDERMRERPMDDLLGALGQTGVHAVSVAGTGCPPVLINGRGARGGQVLLDCSRSSQYLSSLLMAGPLFPDGLDITLPSPAVSAPYLGLTLDMMGRFAVHADVLSPVRYRVPGGQTYTATEALVEPDLSNAGYFWAAGAVTGTAVTVADVTRNSLQGDIRLLEVFEAMGCRVDETPDGIRVLGQNLAAVEVDMADIPDVVPTLAVVAAFARGRTLIRNVAHLRAKECDRIDAVVGQLRKMGVHADQGPDWISVEGGTPRGASIETFNDHRMAMAFAVAGLRVDGVVIQNPGCVAKSFPGFWETFERLYD